MPKSGNLSGAILARLGKIETEIAALSLAVVGTGGTVPAEWLQLAELRTRGIRYLNNGKSAEQDWRAACDLVTDFVCVLNNIIEGDKKI